MVAIHAKHSVLMASFVCIMIRCDRNGPEDTVHVDAAGPAELKLVEINYKSLPLTESGYDYLIHDQSSYKRLSARAHPAANSTRRQDFAHHAH